MSAEAFPLQWPAGRARTPAAKREQANFDCTLRRARDVLIAEVQRLVGRYAQPHTVISSNLALRQDGLPLASQPRGMNDDPGVAVYFTRKGQQMSFACDRWLRVEHNMRAIVKTIEALRGIERWGTGEMVEAAFTGFMALPAPTPRTWRDVLGAHGERSLEAIEACYRRLRSEAHRANDTDAFMAVNEAWEQAKKEFP